MWVLLYRPFYYSSNFVVPNIEHILLSKNIKTIYYNRDCYIKPILKEINYIYYNYNDYLNIQHPWKCSDTQIKNILEYIK